MNKIRVLGGVLLTSFLFAFLTGNACAGTYAQTIEGYVGSITMGQNNVRTPGSITIDTAETVENPEPGGVTAVRKPDQKEIGCLARAMYFESVGESVDGQLAVAHVIFNRVRSEKFGDSICGVVQQRTGRVCQFSWVCNKRPKINKDLYNRIEELAHDFYVNYESFVDMTRGALFFHADYVRTAWSNAQRTIKIGRHIFYKPKEKRNRK